MGVQTVTGTVTILWDDNQTLVFQVQGANTTGCGSLSSFAETVKQAFRNQRTVQIVCDDSSYTPYTANGTGTSYNLYNIYGLIG